MKRVGPLPYACRCGFTFCKTHRLPELHSCDFNFKEQWQRQLRDSFPPILSKKIEKF